jgi:hypothetical protein
METRKKYSGFFAHSVRVALALLILVLFQDVSCAVTKGELLNSLFSGLGYESVDKPPLPDDVPQSHTYAKTIGSSLKYGLIPKESFSPDTTIDRHGAVRLTLMMMGWEFETSLYEAFENLPDLGGSGDPLFFLAAEIKPPAPKNLLVDGSTPLSDSGRDSLVSWARSCRKNVQWNRVLSYNGVDLVIYRQGVAMPGVPNDHPKGGNPIGASLCEPLYIVALAVHPDMADTRIAFAEPLGSGRAPISTISYVYDAIGAVNGGFFAESRPLGTMLLDGVHAGKPLPGRSAVGWNNKDSSIVFGRGSARVGVRTRLGYVEFTKFNMAPPANEASLYTSGVTQAAVGTALDAIELVVRGGMLVERREASMSDHRTPSDGVLIVARGNSRALLEEFQPGSPLDIITDWETTSFNDCTNLIQAGPMLVQNGKFTMSPETFKSDITDKRHPRTLMGTDGRRMFWVVIDGRNSLHSRGATIDETRWVAKSLGLTTAINMDGGGSSQLVWRGIMTNLPSDGKERPLPYALVMLPKGAPMARKNMFQYGTYGAADQDEFNIYGPAPTFDDPERASIIMDTYNPLNDDVD